MRKFAWMIKRIVQQMVQGITEDRLFENASSLSFYTLLSIVPIFAVLLGISKGFGFDEIIEWELVEAFPNQRAFSNLLIQFSRGLLEQSRGGILVGTGVVFLLWSFLGLISNFERSLNEIWQIKESRSYTRRLSDFLALILLSPLFIILWSSFTVFISTELVGFAQGNEYIQPFSPFIRLMVKLIPIVLSFFIFSFLFIFVPNTEVPWRAALIAAFFTSLFFHLIQWIYIHFQIGITSYGAVYGSFAAIPLFLIWLQSSWLITLAGAELSYRLAYKGSLIHPYEENSDSFNQQEIALYTIWTAVKNFDRGEGGIMLKDLAEHLHFHHPILWEIVHKLKKSNLLVQISHPDKFELLQPGKSHITIKDVIDALGVDKTPAFRLRAFKDMVNIRESFLRYEKDSSDITANLEISKIPAV